MTDLHVSDGEYKTTEEPRKPFSSWCAIWVELSSVYPAGGAVLLLSLWVEEVSVRLTRMIVCFYV